MKLWVAIPALALGVLALLAFSSPSGARQLAVSSAGSCVRSVTGGSAFSAADACVFSSELGLGKGSRCKASPAIHVVAKAEKALVWPDDIIELTAGTAVAAWQATIDFVGSLYDYAEETGGDLI